MGGAGMTLDADGLAIRTREEIQAEIEAEIIASPHLNPRGRINLAATSVLGQLIGIVAAKLAENERLMQAVYASRYASSAEGASLDAIAQMQGITRNPATGSTVTLRCTGINGTVITAGSIVRDPDRTEFEWVTTANGTISSGSVTVPAQCSTTGVIAANAETLTEIVTPIAGWNGVTNDADAELGTADETDDALRLRMRQLAFLAGTSSAAAIRSALYAVAGVTTAFVFENPDDSVDANGVPPHAIECVVEGGDDGDIAQAIYDNKPIGIGTYSATSDSGTATTADSATITINFSRAVATPIYVYAKVIHDGNNADIEAEIKAAIVAYGDQLLVGQTIVRSRFFGVIYGVSGVVNVEIIGIDATTLPTEGTADDDDIVLTFRQSPTFDTADVSIDLETA